MVDKFLPYVDESKTPETQKDAKSYAKVFEMFRSGRFKPLIRDYVGESGNGSFANPGLVVDGARMKTEPWRVFQELEAKIGLRPFFTEQHFGKREDGFWCVRPGTKINNNKSVSKPVSEPIKNATRLECMPSSKGGKEFIDQSRYVISYETLKKLKRYYSESVQSVYDHFGILLSTDKV